VLPGTPLTYSGADNLGTSCALSSDGNTALLGDSTKGKGVVFRFTNGSWVLPGTPLTNSGAPYLGTSCALSSDGNTALLGDYNSGKGAVFLFTNGSWVLPGTLLTNSEAPYLGQSCALSSDGNTALLGDYYGGKGVVFLLGPNFKINNTFSVYNQNVGIGTNTPGSNLEVKGNLYASNALSTTNIFTTNVTASSYLGVGGATGGATATVTGNVYVSNALTTTNVYLMSSTLASTPTRGEITYNGSFLYGTINSANGRGIVPVRYMYSLTSDSSSPYNTGSYFFTGSTSPAGTRVTLDANSTYEVECICIFLRSAGASTTATFTLNLNAAASYMFCCYAFGSNNPVVTLSQVGKWSVGSATIDFNAQSTNNTTYNLFVCKVSIITGASVTLNGLSVALNTGTATSKAGSYFTVTKIGTSGTFV
jgi:hypothetical protein